VLVDDHQGLLDKVSALLQNDFDVAAVATSGREALRTVRDVDPDLIVLDISMPGLNGFDTMRALRNGGSRARVVFLSTFDADDYVSEAFKCGGRGFVAKVHVARDLPGALEQVFLGRLVMPSLTGAFRLANGGGHAMQLYQDAESFLDGVAGCLHLALQRGDATCVLAPEHFRKGLAIRLDARGWDIGGSGHERYRARDAGDALEQFMRNGLPDAARLSEIVTELEEYRGTVTQRPTSRLAIFGTMAGSLTAEGNEAGAIALETHWDALTRGLPFFTLCGYDSSRFQQATPDLWSRTCAAHWAVVSQA
jgi:CheY-like chemotaxis protein